MQLIVLLFLLVICAAAPGFYIVRKLRWSPLEKLCGSIGLSLILVYLTSTALYWLNLGPWAFWAASATCLISGVLARRDVARLLSCLEVRRAIAAFCALLVWTMTLLFMIRHYSGGAWICDWLEHFQRMLFFLHHLPKAMAIQCGYEVPSRPPMMNLLSAFFLAQTGDLFEFFQVSFTFLNLLLFFPIYLLSGALWPRGRRRVVLLSALFALNPMMMQSATYTWTKQLAAFYVILGLWLYLAALRKNDRLRMVAAFVSLAAGVLVHYSAGLYLVFVVLHYLLFQFWRRRRRWSELAITAVASGALLTTWFGWAIAVYGWRTAVISNTSVNAAKRYQGRELLIMAGNLFDTVVPYPLRPDAKLGVIDQPSQAGHVRDFAFLLYQHNAILALGSAGGPLVLFLLYRAFRRKSRERAFWLMLIPFCLVLAVAVQGDREEFGVAHITLQTLMAAGLAFLAGGIRRLPRVLAVVLIAGCATDFALGVFLQGRMENIENTPEEQAFALEVSDWKWQPMSYVLSQVASSNWHAKHLLANCETVAGKASQFDTDGKAAGGRSVSAGCQMADEANFGGWYSRHNGEMTFLGDWAAGCSLFGVDVTAAALVLMAVGWIVGLARGSLF